VSTITWIGSDSGDWETGIDWSPSPGASTAGDDILITQPGTYRITEAEAESANSVLVDAPDATLVLDAPLTVAGAFTLDAGTVVFSGGSLAVGSFTLNGGVAEGYTVDINAANSIVFQGGSLIAGTAVLADPAGTIALPVLGSLETGGVAMPIATTWTQSVPFAQFNPALGTLASINAGLSASVAGSVLVQSLEGSASSVTVSLPGAVSAGSPNGYGLANVSLDPSSTASLGAAGSAAVVLTPSGSASVSDIPDNNAADVASFTGSGSAAVTLSADFDVQVAGPANMVIGAQASAAATASVQYAYAPMGLGTEYSDDYGSGSTTTIESSPVFAFVSGDTTAPQTFAFADQTTGWDSSLAAEQFNPALGTLEAVNITVTGDIQASVAVENQNSTSGFVSTTQMATVALALPDGTSVTADPTVKDSMNLGAYDGTLDYAGTSGRIDQGLTQTTTETEQVTSTADLAAFLGQGTVTVPISDLGTGTLDGPANLAAALLAQSGAIVTIDYTYLPPATETWTAINGGTWDVGSDWSSSPNAPGTLDTAVIAEPGTYTVTQTGTTTIGNILLNNPDAALDINGDLSAGTITLDAGGLWLGGTLANATVLDNGGGVAFSPSGTLSNVTWRGELNLTEWEYLTIVGSLTVTGADGTSPGTINVFPYLGDIDIKNDETFSNVTLSLGAAPVGDPAVVGGAFQFFVTTQGLVFSSSGTMDLFGSVVISSTSFTNRGAINVSAGNNSLTTAAFSNIGTLSVSNGAELSLDIGAGSYVNAGLINLSAGGVLVVQANDFSLSELGALQGSGIVVLGGTLDNIGSTIAVTNGTLDGDITVDGVLLGGTVISQGGTVAGQPVATSFNGASLEGVVWQGPLGLIGDTLTLQNTSVQTAAGNPEPVTLNNSTLYLTGGDTLGALSLTASKIYESGTNIVGPATLTDSTLYVTGGSTLDGTTLNLAGSYDDVLNNPNFQFSAPQYSDTLTIPGGSLTLGAAATLSAAGNGTKITLVGGTIVNNGAINLSGTGQVLASLGAGFVNTGEVNVGSGNLLQTNTFVPVEAVQAVDAGLGPVESGNSPPPPPVYIDPSAGIFDNTGSIAIGAGSTLEICASATSLSNTGTISFAGPTSALQLDTDTTVTALGTLTGTPGLVVGGTLDNVGNTLTIGSAGMFDRLQVGVTGAAVLGAGVITGGTVTAAAGASLPIVNAVLDNVTWEAPVDLSGANATLSVEGTTTLKPSGGGSRAVVNLTGAGSSINFASGTLANAKVSIGSAGGTTTFSGPTESSALTLSASTTLDASTPGAGLIDIEGQISNLGLIVDSAGDVALGGFASTSTGTVNGTVVVVVSVPWFGPAFDNQGTIIAAAGAGSTFTVGPDTTLTNEGLIQVGNGDDLVIQAESFSNTGTIALNPGGTVEIAGTSGNPGTIAFTAGSDETLILDDPGSLVPASIENFNPADKIEFGTGTTAISAWLSNTNTIAVVFETTDGSVGIDDLTGVSFATWASQQISIGTDTTNGDSFIQVVATAPRTLVWTGATNTVFAAASNWDDTTNGLGFAAAAPDALDTVVFGNNGGAISGTGTAAAIMFDGGGAWQLGSGASLSTSGAVVVGESHATSLLFDLGSNLTEAGSAVIADTANAGGSEVNVTGTGSVWRIGTTLVVGNAGFGELSLSQGATVTAAGLDAGVSGSAVISLSGTGTGLALSEDGIIADDGSATMSILNGATMTGTDLTVGSQGNASGALTVSDTGSLLQLSGTLYVGTTLGTGELTVGPNATIIATSIQQQGQVVLEGGLLDPNVVVVGAGYSNGGVGTVGDTNGLIDNDGTLLAHALKPSNALQTFLGTIVGQGIMEIDNGSTLEVGGPVLSGDPSVDIDNDGTPVATLSSQEVEFTASTGVLKLDDIGAFAGTIGIYHAGDQFVITGGVLSGLGVSGGEVLTVSDSGNGGVDQIAFAAPISAGQFSIVGGNTIDVVQCFAAGTLIETASGPVAVERLSKGDLVVTAENGRLEPVVWLGRRSVDCAAHPRPAQVWPIRVRKGAFGPQRPARDLFLSPDHAVFVNDVLVPVKYLANGTSIAQVRRPSVVYYHIELPQHDLLLAEGLAVESYLDVGDRSNFENGGGAVALFPNFTSLKWETEGCAALVVTGPELAAARASVRPAHRRKAAA
jgi:T5SS/PEP-CTERM-associated repeat protein